jgi:hypothetical protein
MGGPLDVVAMYLGSFGRTSQRVSPPIFGEALLKK